jgi:hypothetical protein
MTTPRRDFLGWLGGSAMLAATGMPFTARELEAASLQPIAPDWDVSWVGRIKGKYRAVFDSPGISEGASLFRAVIWKKQYHTVFGTDPADMSSVLVFRHEGIALAMDDAYWSTFEVGKRSKFKDLNTNKWAVTNPIRTTAPDTPAQWKDFSIEAYLASGGVILACNMAFGDVVDEYARKFKIKDKAEARKMALEHLVPGIILQPSGIFAALHAQEAAACRYILAS